MGICFLPNASGIILLVADAMFSLQIISFIKWHYLNYIEVYPEKVIHKDKAYSWNDVCITMDYMHDQFMNTCYYRIYFNDKYYTREEIKDADKEGFCIDFTKERTNLILNYYKKKIHIIGGFEKNRKVFIKQLLNIIYCMKIKAFDKTSDTEESVSPVLIYKLIYKY